MDARSDNDCLYYCKLFSKYNYFINLKYKSIKRYIYIHIDILGLHTNTLLYTIDVINETLKHFLKETWDYSYQLL